MPVVSKEFKAHVYNRQTRESYFHWARTTTDSTWSRVVTVPSTPSSSKEQACVDAEAKVIYKAGQTWVNTWEEELGWIPCRTCTS